MTDDSSWFAQPHGSPSPGANRALTWADRFRGAMLGGAVGDALGAGVRTRTSTEIQRWFGFGGVMDYLPAFGRRGAATELSQLAVFTLEALLRAKAVNGDSADWLPTPVVRTNYLRWLYTQGVPWEYAMSGYLQTHPEPAGWMLERPELFSTRNPAGAALTGLGRLALQPPPTRDPAAPPLGNGVSDCIAFTAPTMVWNTSEEMVFTAAADIAHLFTDDHNAQGASGLHADVLSQVISGVPLWDAVSMADTNRLARSSASLPAAVRRTIHAAMFLAREAKRVEPAMLDAEFDTGDAPGELGVALVSVAAAGSFAEAVLLAVNQSADSCVTGMLAGQLAGALHGPDVIPRHWLEELELREIIETLCEDAAEAFAPPPPPPPLPKWAQRYVTDQRPAFSGPLELPQSSPAPVSSAAPAPEPRTPASGTPIPSTSVSDTDRPVGTWMPAGRPERPTLGSGRPEEAVESTMVIDLAGFEAREPDFPPVENPRPVSRHADVRAETRKEPDAREPEYDLPVLPEVGKDLPDELPDPLFDHESEIEYSFEGFDQPSTDRQERESEREHEALHEPEPEPAPEADSTPASQPQSAQVSAGEHALAEDFDAGPSLTERVLGCFLGGALGDSLGADLEFLSAEKIAERFGPGGPRGLREAYGVRGAITDDTQMTLFTAEGLIRGSVAKRMLGTDDPMPELQLAYQRWLHTQGVEWPDAAGPFLASHPVPDGWLIGVGELFSTRAPGKTTFRALERFGRGYPAGSLTERINDSKGCGAVMRAAPAALSSTDPAEVFDLGARLAAVTHGHPSGYLPAGALAVIVQQALLGHSLDDGVWLALQVLETWENHEETSLALKAAVDLGTQGVPTPQQLADTLGGGWVGEEALAIAVCSAVAGGDDVELALRTAVNHSGVSDSTGAICGNIVGALTGVRALPMQWLAELELREVIEQAALDCVAEFGVGEFLASWVGIEPGDGAPPGFDAQQPTDAEWTERYPVRELPVSPPRPAGEQTERSLSPVDPAALAAPTAPAATESAGELAETKHPQQRSHGDLFGPDTHSPKPAPRRINGVVPPRES